MAYSSNQSGNFDIWVRPLAGGDPFQLTNDTVDDACCRRSRLAWQCSTPSGLGRT